MCNSVNTATERVYDRDLHIQMAYARRLELQLSLLRATTITCKATTYWYSINANHRGILH